MAEVCACLWFPLLACMYYTVFGKNGSIMRAHNDLLGWLHQRDQCEFWRAMYTQGHADFAKTTIGVEPHVLDAI